MKTADITRGSLITAFGVVLIYLCSILPTSRLFILGAASCLIPFSVLRINLKGSLIVYAATSLISVMLIGVRDITFAYILFFGIYGIVKYLIEKLRKLPAELFLKLVYYNLSLLIIFFIFKSLFFTSLSLNMPLYAAVIVSEFVFLIYDYVLTLFVGYAQKHFMR